MRKHNERITRKTGSPDWPDILPANVAAEITDATNFNVPAHTDTDSDGDRVVEGITWGSIDEDSGVISLQWKVTFFDGDTDECTLILTPQ